MRNAVPVILALALLVVCSSPAGAGVFGPLTIKQIQDPGTAPNPIGIPNPAGSAAGDTVGPTYGIITGFDTFPTGFAFYLQNSEGGPWTGIDVFTGGSNTASTLGLQVGDSVCVEGALAEFSTVNAPCAGAGVDGETEIIAKNGSFGSNLIITKIDSGHPLPPYHIGTVNELQELCTNGSAEQWEGCLVRVNGPMRICRTNATGGLGTFRAVLVVDNTVCPPGHVGACDSMFIDLSTLANPALSPGTVDQIVDFAQGIYGERSRGYRIQARNSNDYGIQAPPALVRIYDIGDTKYRVILDRDVTQASAEDEGNYSILSILNPPDLATQIDPTTVDLTVNVPLAPGAVEQVEVTNLTAVSSGLTMSSAQGFSFHYGILSPSQVQGPDKDSLAANPCRDVGKYLTGGPVTVRGVCVARYGNLYYLQGSNSPRNGVAVFAPPAELTQGRQYTIVGNNTEFNGETEVTSVVYVADEGTAATPDPVLQSIAVLKDQTCDLGQGSSTGEDYEGMLVRVEKVAITENRTAGQSFFIAGPGPTNPDTMLVSNSQNSYTFAADSGHVANITGVLSFGFGSYRILPRSNADIVDLGAGQAGVEDGIPAEVTFAVFPNPARTSRVSFGLPRAQDVTLGVYDVAGRQVAVLAKGAFPAGTYSRDWDGRDARGNRVSSGMYFYRLKLGSETRLLRAVKLN